MASTREICLSFDEDLSALRDGELSPERETEVQMHLAACDRCQSRLATFGAVDADLRGLGGGPVPSDLESRLLTRLAAERRPVTPLASHRPTANHASHRPTATLPSRRQRRALAWVAALATAAAVLVVYAGLLRSPGPLEPGASLAQHPGAGRPGDPVAVQERPASAAGADLDAASDEDLSVAIELETLEDLDVIANLEILEQLDAVGGKDQG